MWRRYKIVDFLFLWFNNFPLFRISDPDTDDDTNAGTGAGAGAGAGETAAKTNGTANNPNNPSINISSKQLQRDQDQQYVVTASYVSAMNIQDAKKNLDKPLLRRKSDLPADILTQKSLENYKVVNNN